MENISYARHRFAPVIIQHAVWLYFRFPLGFRDVEDLVAAVPYPLDCVPSNTQG
jgi:putative transposase